MSAGSGHSERSTFIVIWEFRVRPGRRRAFEKAYGPSGEWVRLFSRMRGYIRTELIRDPDRPLRYVTVDIWRSRLAYERSKRQRRDDYMRIHKRCSLLTIEEKLVGKFDTLFPQGAIELRPARAEIRPASKLDIPQMINLAKDSASAAQWPETAYQRIFEENPATRLAFTLQGRDRTVEGFAVASLAGEDCELENIVVAAGRRRAGWGKRLLAEVITAARSRNGKQIILEVRESARPARGLYERYGFALVGRRPGYYRDPTEDAILYRLEL
jgi:ribosomal-protein-alanine acetyltransferase